MSVRLPDNYSIGGGLFLKANEDKCLRLKALRAE